MSPLRLVACGTVALAHAHLSLEAADAAAALSEIATDALISFQLVTTAALVDDAQSAGQPTTSPGFEQAMGQMRAQVAGSGPLMRRLASCEDGEAVEDGEDGEAVVCTLARAVLSVVREQPVEGASMTDRPTALAALHRWDAVGTLAGKSGHPVAASHVRGLALLLGQPDSLAVDGVAAFAFRALQGVSDQVVPACSEKEGAREGDRWPRLQRAATEATDALAAPAAHCLQLLLGEDTHSAALAMASELELTVCMFVVKAHAALQALSALSALPALRGDDDEVYKDLLTAQGYAAALLAVSIIDAGPVLGGAAVRVGGAAVRAVLATPAVRADVGERSFGAADQQRERRQTA